MTATVNRPHNKPIGRWENDDGYWAEVWPASHHRHGEKRPWWWQIAWPGGIYQAPEGECIHTPERDETDERALDVLATLANFLSAWEEAMDYEQRYSRVSENSDLFPKLCLPFEPAIEEFSMWAHDHGTTIEEDYA